MIKKAFLQLLILLSIPVLAVACNSDNEILLVTYTIQYQEEKNMHTIDSAFYTKDLRVVDENTNKHVIDLFLQAIGNYPSALSLSDFLIGDNYADFIVGEVDVIDNNSASFQLTPNDSTNEKYFGVEVSMYFYDSQLDAHDSLRQFILKSFAAPIPSVFASELNIGDFALDSSRTINFIRANVVVDVRLWRIAGVTEYIDIIELAREIDRQILEIIASTDGQ